MKRINNSGFIQYELDSPALDPVLLRTDVVLDRHYVVDRIELDPILQIVAGFQEITPEVDWNWSAEFWCSSTEESQ